MFADLQPGNGVTASSKPLDPGEIDTIVVPAREEGFRDVFLGEDEWHSVRIHGSMIPQIRYVAAYRVAPMSAITHIAKVREVSPAADPGKWRIIFDGPASEIRPISLVSHGRVRAPQNIRYTTRQRLMESETLDDVWATSDNSE